MQTSDVKKNRTLEIISIFAVLAVVIIVFSKTLDPVKLNRPASASDLDQYILDGLLLPEDTVDVAVIGDSQAMFSLNMEMVNDEGISAFIFGRGGLSMPEAWYTVRKMYNRHSPKVVIIETNMFAETNAETSSVRADLLDVFNAAVYEYLPVFRYHSIWQNLFGFKEDEKIDHIRGFNVRENIAPYYGGEYMFPTDSKSKINFVRRIYMEKIIKLCKENGSEVILLSTPSAMEFDMGKHNTLTEYAEKNGVDYLDENIVWKEIGIDWTRDTVDEGYHLNKDGADKATRYLIDYLEENYQ